MISVVVQGILLGGLYALLALGLALVYKSSKVINLAYGGQMLIIGYFVFYLTSSVGMPAWLAIPAAFVAGTVLAVLLERGLVSPVVKKTPGLPTLILTMVTGMSLQAVTLLIWGGESVRYPFTPKQAMTISGISIIPGVLYCFIAGLAIFAIMLAVFRYTKLGLALRAVAENHVLAQSIGVRVAAIFSASWMMSGVVAGVCAVLVGMVSQVAPDMTDLVLGKGLPVLLLGGMESIPGALIAAFIVGLIESLGGYWVGSLADVLPWLVMLFIVLVRPWGLLGERQIERI